MFMMVNKPASWAQIWNDRVPYSETRYNADTDIVMVELFTIQKTLKIEEGRTKCE
jgi:hypothetical protein